MKRFLVLLFLGLMLVGCEETNNTAPKSQAQWDQTTIKVVWMSTPEANELCKKMGVKPLVGTELVACAAFNRQGCTIYTRQPRSFNDRPALAVLGHEAWHCFGAVHP